MIVVHGEQKSLVSWLIGQEKVLRLWIDEVVANSADAEFVRKLETHRRWLAACIEELVNEAAA